MPEGAVALAHHTEGFNQAFRYGLQYHIELTENMLDVWLHDPPMKNDKLSSFQLPRQDHACIQPNCMQPTKETRMFHLNAAILHER